MKNWRISWHLTKEIEIKVQLMAATFSHSFLLWTECAFKMNLQNHPSPVLSVLTLLQIHNFHTQCRGSMTRTLHLQCFSNWLTEKNNDFSYSPALNAQHVLQPPILFFGVFFQVYFSAVCCILSICNIYHGAPCSLMTVQMCTAKHSCHNLETEFPECSPSPPPTPFSALHRLTSPT